MARPEIIKQLTSDSSARRYARIKWGEGTAVLLEIIGPPSPGHSLADTIRVTKILQGQGVRIPAILDGDESQGFLVLEDFGDVTMRAAIEAGGDAASFYERAVDVLKQFQNIKRSSFRRKPESSQKNQLPDPGFRRDDGYEDELSCYYVSHIHKGRRRVMDWYVPMVRRSKNPDGFVEKFLTVFDEIENKLPPCPQVFCHVDFHPDNLMVLGGGTIGILDFQGAMIGPLPYDLVNLLEDARADVPDDIRTAMMDRYCEGMTAIERQNFQNWYEILALQFHCRVIGQFIRLALKDNKDGYLKHIPRLEYYIHRRLAGRVFAPLKAFFDDAGIDFNSGIRDKSALNMKYIRDDSF